MTITLISQEQYHELLDIYQKYPQLTLQNKGYETLNKSKLSIESLEKFNYVETVLKNHIKGFQEFNNFRLSKSGEVVLRFQYDWTADEPNYRHPFTGVGYLTLRELYRGFDSNNLTENTASTADKT